MTPFVLWLGDPRAADPALVGPKAAHLSALAAGYDVPAGFCLTARAYRHAERVGGLDPDLSAAIVEAYARLVGDASVPPPVAVRSSALDEDGPATSFAGQHETILGVVGLDALLEAVVRTWASLLSDAALTYRRDHGLPLEGLALAVLVQRLIVADAAGVAFSVDPVSGRRDRLVVNATWGLGESLVGGSVTPDTWTLDKDSLVPVTTRLASKERMTVAVDGGSRETGVPGFLRDRPSLTDDELRAVAYLARDLESRHGWAVDVEFVVADGRLHLLQCRPVTALPDPSASAAQPLSDLPAPWREPDDADRFWQRDLLHFPGQVTPIDHEFLRIVHEVGVRHGARTYGIPVGMLARRFWTFHYESEVRVEWATGEAETRRAEGAAASAAVFADFEGTWRERWLPEIERHLAFWDDFALDAADTSALLAHLDETHARLQRVWQVHFELVIPLLRARAAFVALFKESFEGSTGLDAVALLQGHDSLTTRDGAALWAVRDAIAAVPELRVRVSAAPPHEVIAIIAAHPDGTDAHAALQAYLRAYGRRTLYMALSAPSLLEDPTPVAVMLRDALASPERDPRVRHTRVVAERTHRVAAARARLLGYPRQVRREFETRLADAQFAVRLDEDHAFLIDFGATAAVRRVLLEVGQRLVAAGSIDAADDAFLLTWEELRDALAPEPTADPRPSIAERRSEMRHYADLDPPETLGTAPDAAATAGDDVRGRTPPDTRDPDAVMGSPGSSGIARGRARVLRDLRDAGELRPGEVLVATTTSQPWTPLFAAAAALVTDTGGILSHTAVVAREYGLPAVVGTRVATRRLRTGMLVEVDGDRGLVRILHEG